MKPPVVAAEAGPMHIQLREANRSLPDHGSRVRGMYKIDMDGFGVYQELRNDVA